MPQSTRDLRIRRFRPLVPPAILLEELPLSDAGSVTVMRGRADVVRILRQEDDRLVVVVGPCSVHEPAAGLDYAQRLRKLADEVAADLCIVMRVYFEKPRTTVGWKGLINDPRLDGSFVINEGLRLGRRFLLDLAEMGLPAGCEFLDPISPQFISDLVSWGAIGARTTESQVHRELASRIMIDTSHGNSSEDSRRQPLVARTVAEQVAAGEAAVLGVMMESFLVEGRQELRPGVSPRYGQSITDACLSWEMTVPVLHELAQAVRARRARRA